MQMHVAIGGLDLLTLLDSDSTHNFISVHVAECSDLRLHARAKM